ncbi:MAG TPA: 4'-phosphopantetheinyl transferase superfamily protein [Mucilaginibacter sp.]|jgi:4'-phosphopantetheinyl transferase
MSLIKIYNRYLDDISWVNASACDFKLDNNIDVWRINISSNFSLLNNFLALINPGEIARANRYFHTRDKNRFIISRGALRIILGKYLNQQPSSIELEIGVNKKPHIKNANLQYNISHSGDWILLAVSSSNIGADTELVDVTYNYRDVLEDNFSTNEISYINQTSSVERFFMLWTRKESLTKATGKGLDEDLKLIPCLDGVHSVQSSLISSTTDWLISSFKLSENYLASIADSAQAEATRFWDIYF